MHPELLKALGLAEDTTPEQASAALTPHINRLLAATGKATVGEAVGVVYAFKSSHEQAAKTAAELEQMRKEQRKADVSAEVDSRIKAGLLFESERAFATDLGLNAPDSYRAFLAARTQPVVDTRDLQRAATPTREEAKQVAETNAAQASGVAGDTRFHVSNDQLLEAEKRMNAQKVN